MMMDILLMANYDVQWKMNNCNVLNFRISEIVYFNDVS